MQRLPDDRTIVETIEPLALAAGRRIMEIFHEGCDTETKADDSPVTVADRDAEAIILAGLRQAFPGVPVVAEEEVAGGALPEAVGDAFFLVDPLDGTKEFVNRRSDFTVNIALIRDGAPVVGVVYAPARNVLYSGYPGRAEAVTTDADHRPVDRAETKVRAAGPSLTIVASRSHSTPETDSFVGRFAGADLVSVGSSLKFCLLASGEADLYPRFGRTMEWDTAAGDAVLRAAGGMTRCPDGSPFLYGKRNQPNDSDFANGWFVAASSEAAERL